MSQQSHDSSDPDSDDASDSVSLGAIAPGEPHARAPVELESLHLKPQPGAMNWNGAERRVSSGMPGLVQLGDMLPALRLLVGMLIASLVIAALYFGRDMLIPLALASLLGFLLDPAVTRLKRWGVCSAMRARASVARQPNIWTPAWP